MTLVYVTLRRSINDKASIFNIEILWLNLCVCPTRYCSEHRTDTTKFKVETRVRFDTNNDKIMRVDGWHAIRPAHTPLVFREM